MTRTTSSVIAAAVLALASGCSLCAVRSHSSRLLPCGRSNAAPVIDTVIAHIPSAVIVGSLADWHQDCPRGGDATICGPLVGVVFGILGELAVAIPYAISAKRGYDIVGECRRRDVAESAPKSTVADLTNAAVVASRGDDCVAVKQIAAQVRASNSDFYSTVFANDEALARCLAASEPPKPGGVPFCFTDASDGPAARVCMPSEADCERAVRMRPAGKVVGSCTAQRSPEAP